MVISKNKICEQLNTLIDLGKEVLKSEITSPEPGIIMPDFIEGPRYNRFKNELISFKERFLKEHPLRDELDKKMDNLCLVGYFEQVISILETISNDDYFMNELEAVENTVKINDDTSWKHSGTGKEKVFIVYGHDEESLKEVETFIRRIGAEPIILKNEPSGGLTIIEKIEKYAKEVLFAIVIYSPCDEGRLKNSDDDCKPRARQNVVFEHGYLIAKLSRSRVVALLVDGVETPGDVSGVVYVSGNDDGWRQDIMKEMQNAGIDLADVLNAGTGRIR